MAITASDILDYILANKLHVEDGEYLLQEKVDSMGIDAVESARVWIWGRFLHAAETDQFEAMTLAILSNLDSGDMVSLATIRAALETAGVSDVAQTVMIFDVWCQLAVSNIWQAAKIHKEGMYSKTEAQEMIDAIIGLDAYSSITGTGSGSGSSGRELLGEPVIVTDNYTKKEISIECEGFDPPWSEEDEVFEGVWGSE